MLDGGGELLGRSVLELTTDPTKLRQGLASARAESLRQIGDIRKALGDIGRSMSETGSRMTVGITAPVVALGGAILNVGKNFETTMNQAVGLAGVSRDAIAGVRAEILELGKEVGKTPQELGEAFYFVASAGFDAAEAMDVLRTAATASAAGLGSTQDVARVLGLVINSYGKENITAARAADILTAAVKEGTAEAAAFAGVLGRVVPTAATLGVSFDQVTAAIAAMTIAGLSADEAATSLNQVLVSLLDPTTEARQAMEDMGLSAEGLRKQLREQGLLAVLRELEARFEGDDEAASKVFGNVRALRGVLSLLGLDSQQLNDIFGETIDSLGDLDSGYKETEGSAREMARAEAELHAMLIELSTDVMPVFLDALRMIVGGVRDAVTWFKSLPEPVRETIVQALALAAVVGPLLVVLGALVSTLGAVVGAAKLVALTWIPALITAFTRLSLIAIWGILPAIGPAAQAGALGFKALGLSAIAAAPQLGILGAALAAVLVVYQMVKAGIDSMAAQIGTDIDKLIADGNLAALAQAKRALETGLLELERLRRQVGQVPMFGPGLDVATGLLSDDTRRALEADLAKVNAALTGHQAEVNDTIDTYELFRGAQRTTAGSTREFAEEIELALDTTLEAQRAFSRDMLASIRAFRSGLETAFSEAQDTEMDMSDTLLSIAQKQAELVELDKENTRTLQKGTELQKLEYQNRRAHIIRELNELKLHAALIGDDMHKQQALLALLTGQDLAEGLTSKLPEVKAAYEVLRDETIAALLEIYTRGGPAGDAAARSIAKSFDPKNTASPFHGMKSWGDAAVDAWIAGIIASLKTGDDRIRPYLRQVAGPFTASSPPKVGPFRTVDHSGRVIGDLWIDNLVGAVKAGVGKLQAPLGALADPFRAMVLPQLALAAASPAFARPGMVDRAIGSIEPGGPGRGGDTFQTTLIMPGPSTRDPFEGLDRASRLQRFGILNTDPRRAQRTGRFEG